MHINETNKQLKKLLIMAKIVDHLLRSLSRLKPNICDQKSTNRKTLPCSS